MEGSIRLFGVKGIEINVHLTFLLILIWAAYRWGVQAGVGMTGALFGVVVTVLLFACVTMHELDRLVGMLTEGDVLAALHKEGADVSVGRVMHRRFPVARPEETQVEVQGRMSAARLRSVPVVERDRVVGLLTAQDINEAYRLLKVLPKGWES